MQAPSAKVAGDPVADALADLCCFLERKRAAKQNSTVSTLGGADTVEQGEKPQQKPRPHESG